MASESAVGSWRLSTGGQSVNVEASSVDEAERIGFPLLAEKCREGGFGLFLSLKPPDAESEDDDFICVTEVVAAKFGIALAARKGGGE